VIPICVPFLSGKELEYASDCIKSNWISSRGKYVEKFEQSFAKYCGCKYGVASTSGTTAIHLALASIGLKKGDEVIVPAFTMIASVLPIIYCGATPVLVDSEPETWNIDVDQIETKVTDRTKAILPVHIYGHPVDMGPILKLADEYGLYVVEDAAEAHGAEYYGKRAGGLGSMGCFSFYANKIITCGEGGMVVTSDNQIADDLRSLHDLCFPKGERVYRHSKVGYNYRMTNIQAAIGLAQFEQIEKLVEMRRNNARSYNERLSEVAGLTLPIEKKWAKNVYWMYSLLIADEFGVSRNKLIELLAAKKIETRPFFTPMNKQPVFRDMGLFINEDYPIAESLSENGLNLPSSSGLSPQEIEYVCNALRDAKCNSN
jgi:perosamine synthetase